MLLDNVPIPRVKSIKYLGTVLVAGITLHVDCGYIKRKFYASCNSIIAKCKNADEFVKLSLVKSMCLPLLTYCLGALDLPQYKVWDLGTCWNDSFRKIFHFNRWESVSEIQHYCGNFLLLTCTINIKQNSQAASLVQITAQHVSGSGLGLTSSCVHWICSSSSVQHYCSFLIYFLLCMSSLSICAILLTVFDFSTYVVNKHLNSLPPSRVSAKTINIGQPSNCLLFIFFMALCASSTVLKSMKANLHKIHKNPHTVRSFSYCCIKT